VFFHTKLKSCSLLESKVQEKYVWLTLEGEIDSRKFLYSKEEENVFAVAAFSISLLIVLLKKCVPVNVLL
jgi:hypothetical protein